MTDPISEEERRDIEERARAFLAGEEGIPKDQIGALIITEKDLGEALEASTEALSLILKEHPRIAAIALGMSIEAMVQTVDNPPRVEACVAFGRHAMRAFAEGKAVEVAAKEAVAEMIGTMKGEVSS